MPTRRQEKVARVVKEAVSDAITNHLSDPRIQGFVSVTKIDMAPDLRSADVYLSFFGSDEKTQQKTFIAINHAKNRIQSLVAAKLKSKFCPTLKFHSDQSLKKTLETMNIIEQAARQIKQPDPANHPED